jgi:hypothetical protein
MLDREDEDTTIFKIAGTIYPKTQLKIQKI